MVNSVKNAKQWRSRLRTLLRFLNVNTLVKVIFDDLMCFWGGESLATINLIILKCEEKVAELASMSLGPQGIPHCLQQC